MITNNIKMKKISFLASLLLVVSISFTACREQSEKEKLVEEMKEEGAEIDTKTDDDGNYKIKMESEENRSISSKNKFI